MNANQLDVVTGATGYTGKYLTGRLLAMGHRVRNLTGHPDRPSPFGERVATAPFRFDDPRELVRSLQGAEILYNTYWVRFSHGRQSYDLAVENTRKLIAAAREAGVRRIVHVSITNPRADSPLPYFKGKALLEKAVEESGISYAILRPTVIFGPEDILINNIAWLLRRFPFFAVPGSGNYRLQPIFVEDMAELMVQAGQRAENLVLNAVGPETYTFDGLLRLVAGAVGSGARLIHVNPRLAFWMSRLISHLVGDVVLTWDEVQGLADDLLVVNTPPTGETSLADWLRQHGDTVGAQYHSELRRHFQ